MKKRWHRARRFSCNLWANNIGDESTDYLVKIILIRGGRLEYL